MADLRPQRRIEELEGDREALEHIARALEGRVLPLIWCSAAARAGSRGRGAAARPAQSLKILLEAMPAAIGILAGGALIHVNSAFAYAFGYRSASELIEAGGSDAILPTAPLVHAKTTAPSACAPVDALTRSRRS